MSKKLFLNELKILGLWVATYLVLMVILIFLAVIKFPSERFVRTFAALLPLVLMTYLPYLVIKCVMILIGKIANSSKVD